MLKLTIFAVLFSVHECVFGYCRAQTKQLTPGHISQQLVKLMGKLHSDIGRMVTSFIFNHSTVVLYVACLQ